MSESTFEDTGRTAEDWVKAFAAAIGQEPPSAEEFKQILELAAEAAHSSERIAAPVACWLGAASGRPLEELLAEAERA
jgi:hypothetical protein